MMKSDDLLTMFHVGEVSVSVEHDDGVKKKHSFRVFFPKCLETFATDAYEEFASLYENAAEDEWDQLEWTRKMLGFYEIVPELDKQRYRQFNANVLERSKTFSELSDFTGSKAKPTHEKLKAYTDNSTKSICELVGNAIYVHPEIRIGLDEDEYLEFRDDLLDEISVAWDEIDKSSDEYLKEAYTAKLRDPSIAERRRKAVQEKLSALERGEPIEEVEEIKEKYLADVVRSAMDLEVANAQDFEQIVEDADQLLLPIHDRFAATSQDQLQIDSVVSDALIGNLESVFDVTAADSILRRTIKQYRKTYAGYVEGSWSPEDWQFAYKQHCDLFEQALNGHEYMKKLEAIDWIANNLVNRNSMIRLMLREAESVLLDLLSWHFRNVYRKIRKQLTYAERRAFQLMYFRQPFNGYRIAAFDNLSLGFAFGMDDETRALCALAMIVGQKKLEENDVGKQVAERWQAYLRFYPFWVELTREDEKERKYSERRSKKRVPFEQVLETEKIDLAVDCDKHETDSRIQYILANIAPLAEKYCSNRERQTLVEHLCKAKSQMDIARDRGVSQQSISKLIRSGLEKIKNVIELKGVAA